MPCARSHDHHYFMPWSGSGTWGKMNGKDSNPAMERTSESEREGKEIAPERTCAPVREAQET